MISRIFTIKWMALVRDVLVVAGVTLAIMISCEIVARAIWPEKVRPLLEVGPFQFHNDYLFFVKPNATGEYIRKEENGGYIVRWQTNSDAFRGAELRDDPPHRIMVYGDSNIQAIFSGRHRTFPCQLEQYLGQYGLPGAEVINAGVIGFGPDQSLLRFEREVAVYQPDLVIFHVFADNDFGDIIKNRLFRLDENGGLEKTGYTWALEDRFKAEWGYQVKRFFRRLVTVKVAKDTWRLLAKKRSSRTSKNKNKPSEPANSPKKKIDAFQEKVKALQKRCQADYKVYKESTKRYNSVDYYDIDVAITPEQPSARLKKRLMAAVLKQAQNLAEKTKTNFLVVIQPSVHDLTKNNPVLNYEHLARYPGYKKRNLTDAVAQACEKNHINCVNLYSVFQENHPEDLFLRAQDVHWSDQGQRLAARKTARYILQHSLIK